MVAVYSLLSVFIVSLISLVGVFALSLNSETLKKITMFLVSLSAGTMLGGAVLHLMPEAIEKSPESSSPWLWFLGGIILFFILEKIICWRHCHIPTSSSHPHHLGKMNLIGDGLHNFIDGIIIAGAFIISPKLGIITTIAVISHEIPQEIGDFGVLIYAGYSRAKAIFLNFMTALSALLGAVLTLLIRTQTENILTTVIPFAAGGFIYIAMADLMPELKKDNSPSQSIKQFIFIVIGIGFMLLIKE